MHTLDRRRFLQLGGTTIALAAIFAACGGDDDNDAAGENENDDAASKGSTGDARILRTSASVELAAVEVYQKLIDSGLVTTAAAVEAAMRFKEHHTLHADLFNGAAKAAGGETFDQPNSVVMQSLAGPLGVLKDENAAVTLALQLENVTAATCFAAVGQFETADLNRSVMSVGGIAARHAAVLSGVLRQPQAPKAFLTADGAIDPGAGI